MGKMKHVLERMQTKGNTPPLLVGMQIYKATLEITMGVSQKSGNQIPQDTTIPLLGIYPKDAQSYYKDICSAAYFVIARTWK